MAQSVRRTITISPETDRELRSLIAQRRGRRGDYSRFVEDAVNQKLLWEIIDEVRAHNAHRDPAEIEALVDREVAAMRAERAART